MKSLIVLDGDIAAAFKSSIDIEKELKGDWVYFDFSDGASAKGLYQLSSAEEEKIQTSNFQMNHIKVHDDFLDHLLGLFTPSLSTEFSLTKNNSFKKFCDSLNTLLLKDSKIFDLSRSHYWIMHSNESGVKLQIGPQLKDYLDFT